MGLFLSLQKWESALKAKKKHHQKPQQLKKVESEESGSPPNFSPTPSLHQLPSPSAYCEGASSNRAERGCLPFHLWCGKDTVGQRSPSPHLLIFPSEAFPAAYKPITSFSENALIIDLASRSAEIPWSCISQYGSRQPHVAIEHLKGGQSELKWAAKNIDGVWKTWHRGRKRKRSHKYF